MEKYKYTCNDNYIVLAYKVDEKIEPEQEIIFNGRKIEIPKINIDPKVRLAALSSISDGSSYFQKKLAAIEKSIDSNRINLDTIDYSELNKLKSYILQNLESELQNSKEGTQYLLNLYNLFLDKNWFDLIERLINYTTDYCTNHGFENNIPFLVNLYKFALEENNQIIKSRIYSYLQKNHLPQYINDSNIELIEDIPDLCNMTQSNTRDLQGHSQMNSGNSGNSGNQEIFYDANVFDSEFNESDLNIESLDNVDDDNSPDSLESQINSIQESLKHPSQHQPQHQPQPRPQHTQPNPPQQQRRRKPPISRAIQPVSVKKEKEVLITNCLNPFISSVDSPIRYLKLSNIVYIFGNIEIGTISSMADQNQKRLFKLQPDLCPKYDVYLFVHQESHGSSYNNIGNFAKIKINKKGEFVYMSDDLINWNTNKIKLYFDSKCYVCN